MREPHLQLLEFPTIYDLLTAATRGGVPILELIDVAVNGTPLDYNAIYTGQSEWKILPPIDHPEPARCIISGTGLTHLGSARSRDSMHEKIGGAEENLTDSMKMFRWGVEGGKPAKGFIGIAPEWFYKGTAATNLRGHNQKLDLPSYAEDGGEEAEIAGVYLVSDIGRPVRIGMTQGNEYSDHVFEKKNYLNLAGSKMRQCSIGPELVLDPDFASVKGKASILRDGKDLWSKPLLTGEDEMCHSLANIEHHHFKFAAHRRPGDVHIHFYGACALSFGDGVKLQNGDVMQVAFKGFGRPLLNTLSAPGKVDELISVLRLK